MLIYDETNALFRFPEGWSEYHDVQIKNWIHDRNMFTRWLEKNTTKRYECIAHWWIVFESTHDKELFCNDYNIIKRVVPRIYDDETLAPKYRQLINDNFDYMALWCDEFIKAEWGVYMEFGSTQSDDKIYYCFEDPKEYMLFKLKWS